MDANKKIMYRPENMGRMESPDGSASIKGLCGDTMEIYLSIHKQKITDARFLTDGCSTSLDAGSVAASLAVGKTFYEVLRLSPADVIDKWADISQGDVHCAILAINTLHKALADYLLRWSQII